MEASAQEACAAVAALDSLLSPGGNRSLEAFAAARRKDKQITNTLEEMLITTFVTPMEREDIEALADALYKVPKTVEKFAERYLIVVDRVKDIDFNGQVKLMAEATQLVLRMTQALKAGRDLGRIKGYQNELQRVEERADDLLLTLMQPLYQPGFDALKAVILYDLFALNEKVVDRCRDAGNVLSHVLLKNS
ncbi:MAG TPA: pit accessory protein [Verrucomicrobiales bacterium]|nr:pit accessory protein [Verrucomicrobiales bacterium]